MKKLIKIFVPILLVFTGSAVADHHHISIYPTITSIHANNCFETNHCEEKHDILTVKINTNARNSHKIKISEKSDFSDSEWLPYSNSIEYKLSPGYEEKTLYVKVGKQITLRESVSRIMSSKVKKIKYQPKGTLYFASLGDSYASGEGAPDVERINVDDLLDHERNRWTLDNYAPQCHRSTFNARNLTVNRIRQEVHQISNGNVKVKFKDLSCSGATINVGLLGPFSGKPLAGKSRHVLESQVSELHKWLYNLSTTRKMVPPHIDGLFISIGGNDLGFAKVIADCTIAELPGTSCANEKTEHYVNFGHVNSLTDISGKEQLKYNLQRLRNALPKNIKNIYHTAYPDITRDHNGNFEEYAGPAKNICIHDNFKVVTEHFGQGELIQNEGISVFGAELDNLNKGELEWVSKKMIKPLNATLKEFSNGYVNWHFINKIETMALRNGLCVSVNNGGRWFNTFEESFRKQGDVSGSFHPNREGYKEMSKIIYDEIKSDFHL